MKKPSVILLLISLSLFCQSQQFQLIVPTSPVIAGEPFRIQYVVADGKAAGNLVIPDFSPLQYITGPDVYLGEIKPGTNNKQPKNYVFTLVISNPGNYKIPAATVSINNNKVSCQSAIVTVRPQESVSPGKAKNLPTLFLESGESEEQEIRKNLFVKVSTNKKNCYPGEPVTAEFKLYSCIETLSEVEKNPGFYGFTVLDTENLGTQKVTTEFINRRLFNVHTIRKVELYPLQAGKFFIDPIKIKNKVPVTNKLTEKGKEKVYELSLETENIPITVMPLPEKNKPATFSGAVGNFTITASVEKNNLSANEQGFFVIRINGNGNMIQLEPPVISWPAGTEGYEAVTNDSSGNLSADFLHNREFRFPFVCAAPGKYTIPSVSFSFYNIRSKSYQTVFSKETSITVYNAGKKEELITEKKLSINEQSERAAKTAGLIVLAIVVLVLLFWVFRRKEPARKENSIISHEKTEVTLVLAYENINAPDNIFYSSLYQVLWLFAAKRFKLSGSEMTKDILKEKLAESGIAAEHRNKLLKIIDDCETLIYTNTASGKDRVGLLNEITDILNEVNGSHQ